MPEENLTRASSPWLLRIELNRETVADKKLTMQEIADQVEEEYGSDLVGFLSLSKFLLARLGFSCFSRLLCVFFVRVLPERDIVKVDLHTTTHAW